jgi:hypothetical protein
MVDDIDWAAATAEQMLAPLGRRWLHVQAVAAQARALADRIFTSAREAEMVVAAAYLHDIGYAPAIANTGFHPLDGGRFVRNSGRPELAALVAQHTGARNEAVLRGIDLLAEFPFENSRLYRTLSYCDLTTGPDGRRMTVDDRVAEIVERYGESHVVSQGILVGEPEFKAIESEIEGQLSVSGLRGSLRTGSR